MDNETARAVEILRSGGLVGFPTETFYGIAADSRCSAALDRLAELKSRPLDSAFPLLLPDGSVLADLVEPGALAEPGWRALSAVFWPGPLTLVLPARAGLHPSLVGATGGVAVRISGHPLARALTRGFGAPLTATSANLRGEAPPSSDSVLLTSSLGGMLDFVLRGGDTPGRVASTVLELNGARALMHRAGAIPRSDIEAVISPLDIQFDTD